MNYIRFKKSKGKRHQIILDEVSLVLFNKYTWSIVKQSNSHYLIGNIDGKMYRFHRLLFDNIDSTKFVDHINGNGLDNRLDNLRICTPQQNRTNVPKLKGKSKYKGVRKSTKGKTWQAAIKKNHKWYYLGCFKTQQEAAKAYNVAAIQLFGEFARLNEL